MSLTLTGEVTEVQKIDSSRPTYSATVTTRMSVTFVDSSDTTFAGSTLKEVEVPFRFYAKDAPAIGDEYTIEIDSI